MPTSTSNYGLLKPLVNNATDSDLWGGQLNDDMDDIDGLLRTGINFITSAKTANFSISVPTTGTTLTGNSNTLFVCDATAGNIIPSLPAANTTGNGFTVAFKKNDSSVNMITVTAAGSDKIDGAATLVISSQYDSFILTSDGVSNWQIVAFKHGTVPKNFTMAAQTFSVTGTYTPTAGMSYCVIEMVGGGGGGGGAATFTGAGGGAGGYLQALMTATQIGVSQAVTIGAAGTAGTSAGGTGGNGGTTSVGALLSCTGGSGGSSASAAGVAGGSGGTATVSTGTSLVAITGQNGGWGAAVSIFIAGGGGSGQLGCGGQPIYNSGGAVAGNSATGFGSGGGGAVNTSNNGGAGSAGYVSITEFIFV